jgi:anti-sigma regulatory factor (Ser/Thr protein kinase)
MVFCDLAGSGEKVSSDEGQRAVVLGSVTIPGSPRHVRSARAFIARALSRQPGIDSDAATSLTSELVTNAIQHTRSGEPGGTVTVVAISIPGGVIVEVIDEGSPGTPTVKGDLYAADGHGLYLVQQLAAQWGYLRDAAGTTVWFHLAGAGGTSAARHGTAEHAAARRGAAAPAGPAEQDAAVRGAMVRGTAGPRPDYAALAAASIPAQISARSSSPVTYGGIA